MQRNHEVPSDLCLSLANTRATASKFISAWLSRELSALLYKKHPLASPTMTVSSFMAQSAKLQSLSTSYVKSS